MHDLMYAGQILKVLRETVKNRERDTKAVVNVYLSSFSHVSADDLKKTFGMLAEDEGYTNTVLNINIPEFCIHCKHCGKTFKTAKPTFNCPICKSTEFNMEKHEEFYVDSVEVEE